MLRALTGLLALMLLAGCAGDAQPTPAQDTDAADSPPIPPAQTGDIRDFVLTNVHATGCVPSGASHSIGWTSIAHVKDLGRNETHQTLRATFTWDDGLPLDDLSAWVHSAEKHVVVAGGSPLVLELNAADLAHMSQNLQITVSAAPLACERPAGVAALVDVPVKAVIEWDPIS